jgi:hypothetical protein
MTFAGAKLLFQIFGGLVFLLTSTILFMIIYNFFLPVDASIGIILGVVVVAIAVGVGMAICSYKFSKEWAVPLLAAWGGIILAMLVVGIANISNGYAIMALYVGFAVGAGYVGKKMNKLVRTTGTAFVGAGIVMKGVSMYVIKGGVPPSNTVEWGLFGGLVVLSVAGTLVQLYIFRDEGKDDDDFMAAEEETRKCGCF